MSAKDGRNRTSGRPELQAVLVPRKSRHKISVCDLPPPHLSLLRSRGLTLRIISPRVGSKRGQLLSMATSWSNTGSKVVPMPPSTMRLWSGKTVITGHLHSQRISPITDYGRTRWGVDTGCLAYINGPQFAYTRIESLQLGQSGLVYSHFIKSNCSHLNFVRCGLTTGAR